MSKTLLIVFVKNSIIGKVKTRLAKTIGDKSALEVYNQLLDITEKCVENVKADKHIYFSEEVNNSRWVKGLKFVQEGENLGDRMFSAFLHGFNQGYEKVILIGSDLPEISPEIIDAGFEALNKNEVVFGPAQDGGYYLIGMTKPQRFIFENKPWSEAGLLQITLEALGKQEVSFSLLQTLNDIDTFEDLKTSKLYSDA